jgi:hypothetical protein
VYGWARDLDDTSKPVGVELYVDKNYGTEGAAPFEVSASGSRSDLSAAGVGAHAFNFSLPTQFSDGLNHTVWAWASDVNSPTEGSTLIGSPKSFVLNSSSQNPTSPTSTPLACIKKDFNFGNSGYYSASKFGNKLANLPAGQEYYIKCDFGAVSPGITLSGADSSCGYVGWDSNAAVFKCKAPTSSASYSVACKMTNVPYADNTCSASAEIGSINVVLPNYPALAFTPTSTPASTSTPAVVPVPASTSTLTNITPPALSFLTQSLPAATAGKPYSAKLQIAGGKSPYTWTFVSTTYPSGCCVLGLNGNLGPTNSTEMNFDNFVDRLFIER